MATAETQERLLTAEEYERMGAGDRPTELVRGRIVELNQPNPRHGKTMIRVSRIIDTFLDEHDIGHGVAGDAGFLVSRNPDPVRGPDVCYFSYERLPRDAPLDLYPEVAPEIAFEIRSPSDRWKMILEKVADYLKVGVFRVCVLDPADSTVRVYTPDEPEFTLTADDELTLPELHADFRVPVARLFP